MAVSSICHLSLVSGMATVRLMAGVFAPASPSLDRVRKVCDCSCVPVPSVPLGPSLPPFAPPLDA